MKVFILNPGISNMLRSDNPINSYSSLHISYWPLGGIERPDRIWGFTGCLPVEFRSLL